MRYWDSSAVVPLVYPEATTPRLARLRQDGRRMSTWMLTPVEVVSALSRKRREGAPLPALQEASRRLSELERSWSEIQNADQVRLRARRLLEVHPLVAADALQLGAALLAAEDRPSGLGFVTLDGVLAEAARREGFAVEGM